MNLPVVIEIAIGLLFIYLILSLLTSEIQELVSLVLQWRAEHLKRSIENLLIGEKSEDSLYQKFTDEFYDNPLIRSLNQEAKGLFAVAFRQLVQVFTHLYHAITGTRNIFGQRTTGPSYIPAETFSVALLQQLNIEKLSQKVSEFTAKRFSEERLFVLQTILDDLRNSLGDNLFLENEFKYLQRGLDEVANDFMSGRTTLTASLEQVSTQLIQFIDNTESLLQDDHHCKEIIRKRLPYIKQTLLRQQVEPTVTEVLRLIFDRSNPHAAKPSPWLTEVVDYLEQQHPELLSPISNLPQPLQQNLLALAEQARTKANSLEEEVRQLEVEVAAWFDRSMQRASGVYRRNSKGIAILIGFLVAVLINADTLQMIDRLAKDSILRESVTQAADQISIAVPSAPEGTLPSVEAPQARLETVKNNVNMVLDEIPLPIGWHPVNVREQARADKSWSVPLLHRIVGWLITGIALSMGASFWYDLLQRVMRVRSTGDKP